MNYNTTSVSTPFWMAPEFILERVFTDKSDIYSFGILFWEIITRDTNPIKDIDEKVFLFGEDSSNLKPIIPNEIDPKLSTLMKDCWNTDPKQRPSIEQVTLRIQSMLENLNNFGNL